jgi:hypothetical protein
VARSHIPVVNASERVQVTQKATNSIVSPNPRKRGDLRVLRTNSRGDVRSGRDLSPLPHLKNQLKKFNLKLKMPLKWKLNLKLRRSLKDPILKMETPMRRA